MLVLTSVVIGKDDGQMLVKSVQQSYECDIFKHSFEYYLYFVFIIIKPVLLKSIKEKVYCSRGRIFMCGFVSVNCYLSKMKIK